MWWSPNRFDIHIETVFVVFKYLTHVKHFTVVILLESLECRRDSAKCESRDKEKFQTKAK